jgi:hypothetical protein
LRANRAFRLTVTREGREPAFLADPHRLDRIEVVSIDDGEVLLYWDVPAKEASKVVRSLKSDLAGLDEHEFMQRWAGADDGAD